MEDGLGPDPYLAAPKLGAKKVCVDFLVGPYLIGPAKTYRLALS